ncbi:MAG: serine/threonine protein kinase [Planctomycetales bacterium]|nr:serine/threonine protein kinase [Planctomycetales bacterium]
MTSDLKATRSMDDPQVVRAIDAYELLGGMERRSAKERILDQFPALRTELDACLKGLDLLADLGPQLAMEVDDQRSVTPTFDPCPRQLGDFQIIREIGRGGMGIVYEATQISLERRVALKVLPFATFLDERYLRRFRLEAQAAATLKHAHIVNVHSVGCERGVYFYAMELVEGQSLAEVLRRVRSEPSTNSAALPSGDTIVQGQLSTQHSRNRQSYLRTMARMMGQVADAMHFAHEQGIIHRDLKPSNLLIDREGKPWITDFGLAHVRGRANTDPGLTITGDVVGTLRYMSPEQIDGQTPVDHRTDIYALGATLYEMVTLTPMVQGDGQAAIMQKITRDQPIAPRELDAHISRDLERIIGKATATCPDDRYTTAALFAADLRNWLESRPIQARPVSTRIVCLRWVQRHRVVASLLGALLVLLVVLAVASPLVAIRYARLAEEATAARELVESHRNDLHDVLNECLVESSNVLAAQPGTSDVRRKLLDRAVAYYDRLLEQGAHSPDVRHHAALAHYHLAEYHFVYGDPISRRRLLEKSVELLQGVVDEDGQPQYVHDLIWSLRDLGVESSGQARNALTHQALESANTLVAQTPANRDFLYQRDSCRLAHSGSLIDAFPERAEQLIRDAEQSLDELLHVPSKDDHFNDSDIVCMLAWSKTRLGDACLRKREYDESICLYSEALPIYRQHWSSVRYRSVQYRCAVIKTGNGLGIALNHQRRHKEAELHLREINTEAVGLCEEFPAFRWAVQERVHSDVQLADALMAQGKWELAAKSLRGAAANAKPLIGDFAYMQRLRDTAAYRIGECAWLSGDFAGGQLQMQQAIERLEGQQRSGEADRLCRRIWLLCPDSSLRQPARVLTSIGTQQGAAADWERGMAYYRLGQWQPAREALERCCQQLESGIAFCCFPLAVTHRQLGDDAAADDWFHTGLDDIGEPFDETVFPNPYYLLVLRDEARRDILDRSVEDTGTDP